MTTYTFEPLLILRGISRGASEKWRGTNTPIFRFMMILENNKHYLATRSSLVQCKIISSFIGEVLRYIFLSWLGGFHDENKEDVVYEFNFY